MGGKDYVAVQCDTGMNSLTGVYTCWEQQDNYPTQQVKCTDDVLWEDTCDDTRNVVILSL